MKAELGRASWKHSLGDRTGSCIRWHTENGLSAPHVPDTCRFHIGSETLPSLVGLRGTMKGGCGSHANSRMNIPKFWLPCWQRTKHNPKSNSSHLLRVDILLTIFVWIFSFFNQSQEGNHVDKKQKGIKKKERLMFWPLGAANLEWWGLLSLLHCLLANV